MSPEIRNLDEFVLQFDSADVSVDDILIRWHRWRKSLDRSPGELKRIGLDLTDRLIPVASQKQILVMAAGCRARNTSFLLKVVGTTDLLARVPWEALEIATPDSIPSSFRFSQQPGFALLRVATDSGIITPREMTGVIRFLVVSEISSERGGTRTDWISAEIASLRSLEVRTKGSARFLFLEQPTKEELIFAIREFRPDVFHLIGQDDFQHSGVRRLSCGLSAAQLADELIKAECQMALALVDEPDESPVTLSSVLVRAGVPTVIGLQDRARDASMAAFTRLFYTAILDKIRVDRAVSEARMTLAGPQYAELLPTLWGQQPVKIGGPPSDAEIPGDAHTSDDDLECVGRDRELQELHDLALSRTVLAITGLGGIGKSHLVRHLVRQIQSSLPRGVWLFDGNEIRDEATLWDELLESTYPWNPHLGDLSQARPHALVVVDNADEWEPTELDQLVERFRGNPTLHLVLVGRSISAVPRENRYEVGPLGSGELSTPSEALFLRWSGFEVNELDRGAQLAILAIGRQLEGVPLAIRIAAARAAVVGPVAMAELLEVSPLQALGGAKSNVFEAIRRSIATLEEADQLLLYRLSIFSGSFDWASLKAVYPDDPLDLLNGVERLGEAGLVRKIREHHTTRLHVTTTVRDYARQTTPERLFFVLNLARRRHLDRFGEIARAAAEAFQLGRWGEGSHYLRLNASNFRDALLFASEKGLFEKVADLCSCLCRPLLESGRYQEFKIFLQEGYRASTELQRPDLEADLLGLHGAFAGRTGDHESCIVQWKRRAKICEEIGDVSGLIDATLDLALEASESTDALALVDRADALLDGLNRSDLEATAGVIRAKIELLRGNVDQAVEVAKRYMAVELQGKGRDSLPYVQTQLGNIWLQLGQYEDATRAYCFAIRAAVDGDRRSQAAVAALALSRALEPVGLVNEAQISALIARDLMVNLGSRRLPEAEARVSQLSRPEEAKRVAVGDPLESLGELIGTLPNLPQH